MMKLLVITLCMVLAYASHCPGNKDPCTKGYDSCVKKLGGKKWAHYVCGVKYIACKKICFGKSKAIYYKCLWMKRDKATCEKEAKAYAEKNCPKPNPCAKKCKKAAYKCYKETKDKKKCRAEFVTCIKKCCHPKLEDFSLEF